MEDNLFENLEELGTYIKGKLENIVENSSERRNTLLKGLNAYSNKQFANFLDASSDSGAEDWNDDRSVKFNALRSCVSTLMSKIAKNKLLPRIITSNAKWSCQEKAIKSDRFIRGLFYQLNAHDALERAFLDTCIYGDGFVKVCNDGENITIEHVYIDEVHVDPVDSYYNDPSFMMQSKLISRRAAKALFPDAELFEGFGCEDSSFIIEALLPTDKYDKFGSNVIMIESWFLPCGDEPGKHVISIGDKVVMVEDYDCNYFPFIHIQFTKPPRGFYSKGLYQEVAPLQRELDRVFLSISDSHRLLSAPKIFVNKASGINLSRITNQIGEIIEVNDINDIKVIAPSPVDGGSYGYMDKLKAWIYEMSGISAMSATSKMPTGIDGASGRALREMSNIESERFALLSQNWEGVVKDLGLLLLKEINRNGDFSVKYYDKSQPLSLIKFSDLDISIDDITVMVFPASSLPSRPEARLATVNEMTQAGFIDQKQALDLLDLPDLESFSEIKNAPKKAIDKVLNEILEKQVYLGVEPFFDLEYLIEQATLYYNLVFGDWDINKEKTQICLDLLRQAIEDASYLMSESQGGDAPPMPPMGGLPEGLGIQATPDVLGMGMAEGELPIGIGGQLPPEALAGVV
jgi:hypothetical protein